MSGERKELDWYEIKRWIKNNPMDAECREDLADWACDRFEVTEDEDADKIWNLVRDLSHLPK